ncbi:MULTISPECIES: hypothetical protein [Streptomyces]|uniref:Uncharacterized protein n=1 Tax=Streptomyces fimbriatus TaxID=68197 RepID=A0ABW0DJG5_STRFI
MTLQSTTSPDPAFRGVGHGQPWGVVGGRSLPAGVFVGTGLRRSLERAPDSDAAHHPYAVGRCAVAGDARIDPATTRP